MTGRLTNVTQIHKHSHAQRDGFAEESWHVLVDGFELPHYVLESGWTGSGSIHPVRGGGVGVMGEGEGEGGREGERQTGRGTGEGNRI